MEEHNKRTRGRTEQLRWAAEVQQEGDEKGQRKKEVRRRPAGCLVDLMAECKFIETRGGREAMDTIIRGPPETSET